MLVSRARVRIPPRFLRAAASFPPKKPRPASVSELDAAIDPAFFLQLRQRIIERHNPSSVELDDPHVQLINKNIFNIRRALEKKDVPLIRESWEELRQAKHLHILTPLIVKQIAQLATASLLPFVAGWDSDRRAFVEEVALASAAIHSTDALNACLLAYLKSGHSTAVLELFEKFRQQLPKAHSALEATDSDSIGDGMELVSSEAFPGRANIFLSVVAAYAIEDSFQAALKAYIDADISVHRYATEDFVRILSYDPALQNKVKMFVERLELAKSVSRPRSLSKHIHNLSKQPASPILEDLYNSILKAVSEPDAYIAADPQNITSTTSVAVTELIWGSFLAAFLRRERNDLAARLWKDVTRLGIQPGISTWNMVMNVYSDRGSVKEVMGAWSTMSSQGVKPDGITYRALLSCLFAANKVTDALRWFRTFETDVKPSSTVEQTLAVYNAMLHGLLPLGREHAKVAFSLLQNMAKEGPKPDLVSHNTVISYHGRRGDFKAMATVINQMSAAGITGDVFTFSTILSALLKAGRTDAPDMVLSIMRKQGVQASVATYTAIINSQTRERTVEHLQAAMRLLDAMEKSQDVTPNEITYTSILAALYRGNWLSADQRESYKQDIVARMKKRKIKFKAGGYNILIKACLTSGEPTGLDDALAFYRDMARNNVPPVDDTWYVLLAGLMQCGEWQIAREVVDEMFSSGAQPGNNVLRLVSKIREKAKER